MQCNDHAVQVQNELKAYFVAEQRRGLSQCFAFVMIQEAS